MHFIAKIWQNGKQCKICGFLILIKTLFLRIKNKTKKGVIYNLLYNLLKLNLLYCLLDFYLTCNAFYSTCCTFYSAYHTFTKLLVPFTKLVVPFTQIAVPFTQLAITLLNLLYLLLNFYYTCCTIY